MVQVFYFIAAVYKHSRRTILNSLSLLEKMERPREGNSTTIVLALGVFDVGQRNKCITGEPL